MINMIRDDKQITLILEKIKLIWQKYRNLRLGQIFAGVTDLANLYYMEDDKLINLLSNSYKVDTSNVAIDNRAFDEEPSVTNKGKVFIHKGDEVKLIFRSEVPKYTQQGYSLGMKDK